MFQVIVKTIVSTSGTTLTRLGLAPYLFVSASPYGDFVSAIGLGKEPTLSVVLHSLQGLAKNFTICDRPHHVAFHASLLRDAYNFQI